MINKHDPFDTEFTFSKDNMDNFLRMLRHKAGSTNFKKWNETECVFD